MLVGTQGGAVQPQYTHAAKGRVEKNEAVRVESTETKLGPSERKKRRKEEGGETERVKERGSVQVMDTLWREAERERERARRDLSQEDMSNSHATESNAWKKSAAPLWINSSLTLVLLPRVPDYSERTSQAPSCRETSCTRLMSELIPWKLLMPKMLITDFFFFRKDCHLKIDHPQVKYHPLGVRREQKREDTCDTLSLKETQAPAASYHQVGNIYPLKVAWEANWVPDSPRDVVDEGRPVSTRASSL